MCLPGSIDMVSDEGMYSPCHACNDPGDIVCKRSDDPSMEIDCDVSCMSLASFSFSGSYDWAYFTGRFIVAVRAVIALLALSCLLLEAYTFLLGSWGGRSASTSVPFGRCLLLPIVF